MCLGPWCWLSCNVHHCPPNGLSGKKPGPAVCGGLGCCEWKRQKEKLSSLNTRLVTDAASYLLNFFFGWTRSKASWDSGEREIDYFLIREVVCSWGGKNCLHPSLEIIYCRRSCSKRCLILACLLLLDKVPCYKFNSVIVEFGFFGFIKNSSEWIWSNIKLLITFFPVLIQRSFMKICLASQ